MTCAVFGAYCCVYGSVCLCIIDLSRVSPLGSLICWAESPHPCRAEPYVSAASTQFRAILFTPNLSSPPSPLRRPTRLFFFFFFLHWCFSQLCFPWPSLSSVLFLSPTSPFPPLPAICSTALAISPPPIHPSPSFLLSLFPHGLVQMSDQTEQHDSQRLAEFPLVRPVAIKQRCVPNLKPALKNMKHWQTKLWLG